jgi:hypothetical protein
MARYQNGSVRIEQRKDGPTWVYRFQVTRSDGKRVEDTKEKDAWDGVDRQHLRETVNHFQPFRERLARMVNSVSTTWKTS